MDVLWVVEDTVFEWDRRKNDANRRKHGLSFEEATEVFFDPQAVHADASVDAESRYSILGYSFKLRMILVVHVERGDHMRIISARPATRFEEVTYDES